MKFSVKWPAAFADLDPMTRDHLDFGAIVGRVLTAKDGRRAVQLPAPFADVVIVSGEELSIQTAQRLVQAAIHFGAVRTLQPKSSWLDKVETRH